MKKWKWGLLAFITGEFLTLRHKDASFRSRVTEEQHLGKKIKLIFSELLGFNKQLIKEAKDVDYRAKGRQVKAYLEKEISKFKKKAQELEDKREELNDEKIKPMLAELDEQFKAFKKKAKQKINELDEEYHFDEKITEIKKQINKLKRRKLS